MSDDALLRRVQTLELDNARLRRLLEQRGSDADLRHQLRNTLSIVRDLVRRSADCHRSCEDQAAHLEGRLDAVLRIQNSVANGRGEGVDLTMLVTDELLAHAGDAESRISIAGPGIGLQPGAATGLALALHELATNAVKFGALGSAQGRLAVTWALGSDDAGLAWLTLDWIETGLRGLPAAPARRGFGREVIERALPQRLGGDGAFHFTPTGLHCAIRLPLTRWTGSLRDVETGDRFHAGT